MSVHLPPHHVYASINRTLSVPWSWQEQLCVPGRSQFPYLWTCRRSKAPPMHYSNNVHSLTVYCYPGAHHNSCYSTSRLRSHSSHTWNWVPDADPFFCKLLNTKYQNSDAPVTVSPCSMKSYSYCRYPDLVNNTSHYVASNACHDVNPIHFRLVLFVRSCSPCLLLRSLLSCFFLNL
jgi:hypothetical protein